MGFDNFSGVEAHFISPVYQSINSS